MKVLLALLKTELRLFFREPVAVFFTLVFPFIPLGLFGTLFGDQPAMPGFRVIDVYVPGLISMVVAYFGLMALPITLSEARDQGALRRFRTSPLSFAQVLAGHLAAQIVLLLLVVAVLVVAAELVFDLRFAGNLLLALATGLVGCVALFTLGFAVVGLCRSARATQAVGSVLFFAMLFLSGAAIPRRQFPPWLKEATDWVPLSHLVDLLVICFIGDPIGPAWTSYLVLLGLAAASFFAASRTFRWQ